MKKLLPLLFTLLLALQTQAQLLYESRYKHHTFRTTIECSAPDGQGNILYSGSMLTGIDRSDQIYLMVKPDTDTLWTRRSPSQFLTFAQDLEPVPGGGFLFASIFKPTTSGAVLLERLGPNGNTVFSKNITNPPVGVSHLLVLPGKDYILGGSETNKGASFYRTDSLGNIKWYKNYGWSRNNDVPADMVFTATGKILAVGTTQYPVTTWHPKLLLLNQLGDSLLGRQLIVSGFNRWEGVMRNRNGVTALSDGGFLFTGDIDTVSSAYPSGVNMGMVVKIDAGLNLAWKYIHRTPAVDAFVFTKSRELADGSMLVLGYRMYPAANSFALYHFNPIGQLINTYPFTSNICTNNVWATTLDVLNDSTFMIGGQCGNSAGLGMYVATVKISNLPPVLPIIQPSISTSTKPELALQPSALGQSYPNPAQDQAIIPYNLPNGTKNAKILLRDITGRQVGSYTLKANQKQGSLPVNLSSFCNGLYLYSLVIDGKPVATKKLAVAR